MGVDKAIGIADLRSMALRRLPRLIADWMEGGAEDELGVRRDAQQFGRYRLVPRYLVDVGTVDTSTTLFGRRYANPFGIAPTGCPGFFRPGGDMMLARAAVQADVPYIMSGSSTASIEEAAAVAPQHAWYQIYAARDDAITMDFVRRSRDAGLPGLVVTVDLPSAAKRERDLRNGFSMPFRYSVGTVLDGLLHPAWTAAWFASGGLPYLSNWTPYAPPGSDAKAVAAFSDTQYYPQFDWTNLERIRAAWPRTLVVKGILAHEDARRAQAIGVDGIVVSTHGGRQGDRLPSALEVLPAILEAAPGLTVIVDGGIRRGADVVTALCLGAHFVLLGRAVLYGLSAGGQAGVSRALAILDDEMQVVMRQIGRTRVADLTRDVVLDAGFV